MTIQPTTSQEADRERARKSQWPVATGRRAERVSAATSKIQPTEESIHRAVVQLLTLTRKPGVTFTHIPNGEVRAKGVGGKLKGLGVAAGWPDLMILAHGRAYGLELKRAKGKLSPAQIAAHEALRAAGCEVATAYGFDEAHRALASWGLLRGS